jgi:hypothetical protein
LPPGAAGTGAGDEAGGKTVMSHIVITGKGALASQRVVEEIMRMGTKT